MRVLYDTSVAIALRDGLPLVLARHVEKDFDAAISVVTVVELEGGVSRSSAGRTARRHALDALYENLEVLDFTAQEASTYGDIVDRLGFARSKIIDRMIAATAVVARLPLATLNEKDFKDVPNLQLVDWSGNSES